MDRQKFDQAFLPFHPGAIRYYKEIGVWDESAEAQNQRNLERQAVLIAAWSDYILAAPDGYKEFEKGWLVAREQALEAANMITLGEGL
jgi:hypothetical protein